MSTAVPPMPSEAAQPGLSEPQRIVNTFVAPSKTFEDIRRNQSWWVPFLLAAIFSTCFFIAVDKKVGWDTVVRDLVSSNSTFQQLSPDIQERQLRVMTLGYKYSSYAAAIFILIFGLLEAVILMVVFNFGMEAAVSFKTSLAIVFYAGLPNLISATLAIISIVVGNPENFNFQNPVATNPAYFMDRAGTSKFLYALVSSLDVFSIWVVILLGMGFAINSERRKVKTGTAITTIAILYVIWKLAGAGLASLRG
jgi:Yip1 domain